MRNRFEMVYPPEPLANRNAVNVKVTDVITYIQKGHKFSANSKIVVSFYLILNHQTFVDNIFYAGNTIFKSKHKSI
jgi:hypothetical protein